MPVRAGAGHWYGGASWRGTSIVPPGCWAGGAGESALHEGGRTGSTDECTLRTCGASVHRFGGLCSAGPLCVFCYCVPDSWWCYVTPLVLTPSRDMLAS